MSTDAAPALRSRFVHPGPVHFEPASLRPARWTERFREAHAGLRRAGSA